MAFHESYRKQVDLLLRTLPHVAEEKEVALKGGTAINLFIRNLPRLSVDIDLTFVPVLPRPDSIKAVNAGMSRVATRIRENIGGAQVHESKSAEGIITKLIVRAGGVQIKIEINPVIRGCVYEPVTMSVAEKVEDAFGFAEIQVVSFADLYAGKIVAAFDRQHPRDLFDVRDLLANEGVDDDLRRAFIVYLLSHDRPMSEVLKPTLKDITEEYGRGFEGMTESPVPLDDLLAARGAILKTIVTDMPAAHRTFLLSFERGEPDWSLLGVPGAPDLPAVKWRQIHLDKLTAEKRAALVAQLEAALSA